MSQSAKPSPFIRTGNTMTTPTFMIVVSRCAAPSNSRSLECSVTIIYVSCHEHVMTISIAISMSLNHWIQIYHGTSYKPLAVFHQHTHASMQCKLTTVNMNVMIC